MHRIVYLALIGVIVFLSNNAMAETEIFPPQNCDKDEIRVMGWKKDADHTYCLSGKELLQAAFNSMGCTKEQTIGYVNGEPVCQASGGNFGGTFTTQIGYDGDNTPRPICIVGNKMAGNGCSCPKGTSAFETSRSFRCTSDSSSCATYYAHECH